MIFPFRSSSIFRNRWIALLWAVGICFTASEIVDSLSGVTAKDKSTSSAVATNDVSDPVANALGNGPPPGVAPTIDPEAR